MLVQPVVLPGSGALSWTVLGDDDAPVGPVERFLAYLTDIERSPNTVRAYAHDLKDFWEFLGHRSLDWRQGCTDGAPPMRDLRQGRQLRGRPAHCSRGCARPARRARGPPADMRAR